MIIGATEWALSQVESGTADRVVLVAHLDEKEESLLKLSVHNERKKVNEIEKKEAGTLYWSYYYEVDDDPRGCFNEALEMYNEKVECLRRKSFPKLKLERAENNDEKRFFIGETVFREVPSKWFAI